jgi:ribosomal protein S18 acetylase RimI-like enzyme
MEIRVALERDVPALTRLLRRSWLTTWAPELLFETVRRFASTDPARQYAESKWREFAVADEGGSLIGMFHVEGNRINSIHLDPAHKRQGFGSRLMDEAEQRIRTDHREARLEVLAFNRGAIEFYKQRGWTAGRLSQGEECGEPVETIEMTKVLLPRG